MNIKRIYAKIAQAAGSAMSRFHFLPSTPPPRNAVFRHWLFSLPRVHDVMALNELDMPWWTYRAIAYVDAWLAERPHPIRVFEFGSGASTAYLRRRADIVYSVENDREFADYIADFLKSSGGVDLVVREGQKSAQPKVASQKSGHQGLDYSSYVSVIDEIGGLFDLIVIDGRAREAALQRSIPHLKSDGVIVFDNTLRKRYAAEIRQSGLTERRFFGLTPTLPYPDQTSILSITHESNVPS